VGHFYIAGDNGFYSYLEDDKIDLYNGHSAGYKDDAEEHKFDLLKHCPHAYLMMLLLNAFAMGRKVGFMEGLLKGRQLVHDNHTVLGEKLTNEELISTILSETGARKASGQREAALRYMESLIAENPLINKYQLGKRTFEDSKKKHLKNTFEKAQYL
jgi:hypothetical protein